MKRKGTNKKVVVGCPAKVNLCLKILGKRPDGTHNLFTVFQQISLSDRLEIQSAPNSKIQVDVERPGPVKSLPGSTEDAPRYSGNSKFVRIPRRKNLVFQAAEILKRHFRNSRGARMALRKSIPIGAGLGGGSSDAASALAGLASLWRLPQSKKKIERLAARLGSDVPFFLRGGRCVGLGRGERLTKIPSRERLWLVVADSGIFVSTQKAYADFQSGARTLTSAGIRDKISLWKKAFSAEAVAGLLENDLEPSVFKRYPGIARLKERLLEEGCLGALLAGSGGCVFGVCRDQSHARKIARRLRSVRAWTVHTK